MENRFSFETFIQKKPLYYKKIDHQRVHKAYAMLKPEICQPLTIHIVGTNGKGSTGRIMATLLHEAGKRVGHFSSPHILKFNERIWIEGEDISNEALEKAHAKLYTILGQAMSESLSYFEYTTLLAFVAMQELDVMILEAGLGGEFDATNVCSKALSVITPIGLDHQDFLGDTIESIARTKLNSMEKEVVLALQSYPEVYAVADGVAQEKNATVHRVEREVSNELLSITEALGWADYLYENAKLALKALDILALPYRLEDLRKVVLFGRFYPLLENVIIDVGHNLLAAKRVVKALKKKYNEKKVVLVYNALDDKDYKSILLEFKPIIKRVEIIPIETRRAVNQSDLKKVLDGLNIAYTYYTQLNQEDEYFVFGSFYLVEAFLNKIEHNIKDK
ncbi:bifunctional folylpolyglutamate synthase/dihydrofolate synthase [bacterium]|nr:bifunctional folylpolyglutamate synthase/dihydrofolate synthase [bacterium]MBU1958770.1 bifunctional folylpolyglutamate synthase/dihydrofolate synthase [bacterium]